MAKQRDELVERLRRIGQLEDMVSARIDAAAEKDLAIDSLEKHWLNTTGFVWTEVGRNIVKKMLKSDDAKVVLEVLQTSLDTYFSDEEAGESSDKAMRMAPRILRNRERMIEKPYLKQCFYIRGILRNRLSYVNDRKCLELLERAVHAGYCLHWFQNYAKEVNSWSEFADTVERAIRTDEVSP